MAVGFLFFFLGGVFCCIFSIFIPTFLYLIVYVFAVYSDAFVSLALESQQVFLDEAHPRSTRFFLRELWDLCQLPWPWGWDCEVGMKSCWSFWWG